MKRFIAILLSFVLAIGLIGCGQSNDSNENTITIVLDWTPNINHTGIYVAQANDYFEEAGLKVSLRPKDLKERSMPPGICLLKRRPSGTSWRPMVATSTFKAFLSALSKGYTYSVTNPKAAADILMDAVPELKSNSDLVYASQQYLSAEYIADASKWGVFDAIRWSAFYDWLNENNLLAEKINPDFGFTNDYLLD